MKCFIDYLFIYLKQSFSCFPCDLKNNIRTSPNSKKVFCSVTTNRQLSVTFDSMCENTYGGQDDHDPSIHTLTKIHDRMKGKKCETSETQMSPHECDRVAQIGTKVTMKYFLGLMFSQTFSSDILVLADIRIDHQGAQNRKCTFTALSPFL